MSEYPWRSGAIVATVAIGVLTTSRTSGDLTGARLSANVL